MSENITTQPTYTTWADDLNQAWVEPWNNINLKNSTRAAQLARDLNDMVVFRAAAWWKNVILYNVKIDVTYANTIISTPLSGGRGSVKEGIAAQDYEVIMNGHLMSPFNIRLIKVYLLWNCCFISDKHLSRKRFYVYLILYWRLMVFIR